MDSKYCEISQKLSRPLFYIDVASSMLDQAGLPDKTLFVPDMLHLNSLGYDLWVRIIRRALQNQ